MTLAESPSALLLRPDQAAELLGISRSKVYALVADGRLPAVRLTGSVRIPRAALLDLVEAATAWPDALIESGHKRTVPVAHTRTAPEVGRASDPTTARRS
jgi:excisionase family DNA binding protein